MKKNLIYSALVLLIFEILFWGLGYVMFQYFNTEVEEFRFEHKEFILYLLAVRGVILLFLLSIFLNKLKSGDITYFWDFRCIITTT